MLNLGAYQLLPENIYCFAPVYIDMTANTSHSSSPYVGIAHLITSLRTLSKAFCIVTTTKRLCVCTTTTTTVLWPFVWDYPGEPVPEETFTHSHLSRSSILSEMLK